MIPIVRAICSRRSSLNSFSWTRRIITSKFGQKQCRNFGTSSVLCYRDSNDKMFNYGLENNPMVNRVVLPPASKKRPKTGPERKQLREPFTVPLESLVESTGGSVVSHSDHSSTEVKKAWNGLTMGARYAPHKLTSSMSICVRSNARLETPEEHGMCALLSNVLISASRSANGQSTLERLQTFGAGINAVQDAEHFQITCSISNNMFTPLARVLADLMINPSWDDVFFEEAKQMTLANLEIHATNPELTMPASLPLIAFGEERTILSDIEAIQNITKESLLRFWKKTFVGQRTVVVVESCNPRSESFDLIQEIFAELPNGSSDNSDASKYVSAGADLPQHMQGNYVGGLSLYEAPEESQQSHAILAFHSVGVSHPKREYVYLASSLFGGGESFSGGGPGKGMLSRFYRLLCSYNSFETLQSEIVLYGGSSLFAIKMTVPAEKTAHSIQIVCNDMVSAAHSVTASSFERAKSALKATIGRQLEVQSTRTADAGMYLLYTKDMTAYAETMARIDAITLDSFKQFIKDLITDDKPTLAVLAPRHVLDTIPSVEDFHSSIKEAIFPEKTRSFFL